MNNCTYFQRKYAYEIIIPGSKFVFQKNDTVVFLSKRDQLQLVENMFRISSI